MALRWPWNIWSCKFNTEQYENRRPPQGVEEQTSASEDRRLELVLKDKFKSLEYTDCAKISGSLEEKGDQCEALRTSVLLEHQICLATLSGEGWAMHFFFASSIMKRFSMLKRWMFCEAKWCG